MPAVKCLHRFYNVLHSIKMRITRLMMQRTHLLHPQEHPNISVILTPVAATERHTLVKELGVDVILPCVMAMDKTQVDMAGRLKIDPITLSHGLLEHVSCPPLR